MKILTFKLPYFVLGNISFFHTQGMKFGHIPKIEIQFRIGGFGERGWSIKHMLPHQQLFKQLVFWRVTRTKLCAEVNYVYLHK